MIYIDGMIVMNGETLLFLVKFKKKLKFLNLNEITVYFY